MQSLNKFLRAVIWLSRVATGTAFLVLIGAVLIQVLGRSVFNDSPVWTEELTRFALLYLAAFGAGLSLQSGDLVNVDVVSESLPAPWPKFLRLIGAALTAVLCAILIMPAWKYTSIGAMQTSPALGWRMDLIHASVMVMLISLMIFSAARVVSILNGSSDGLPQNRIEGLPPH